MLPPDSLEQLGDLRTPNSLDLNYSLNTNHAALSVSLQVSLVWPSVDLSVALGLAVSSSGFLPYESFFRLESQGIGLTQPRQFPGRRWLFAGPTEVWKLWKAGPWADPLTRSHLSSGRLGGTPGL